MRHGRRGASETLIQSRYVINSEAAKKLYKTMAGKGLQELKNLTREWHSDGLLLSFPFPWRDFVLTNG